MGTITLKALKIALDEAAKKWDADEVEVDLDSFADFEETGDADLHLRVSDDWPYPLVLSDAKTPNVEFSGGAPLHGAASAGTQGSTATRQED